MADELNGPPSSEADDFEIAEHCNRFSCRKLITQPAGRGRRREFCSETCRRAADRDYKRAKTLVEHFERQLRRTRFEVAAYGRRAEVDSGVLLPDEQAAASTRAEMALERARDYIADHAEVEHRHLRELRRLAEGVAPLLAGLAVSRSDSQGVA